MATDEIRRLTADEVLSRTNIVDLIKEYVTLRKSGTNYIGLCPFHGDRNPSMSVSETKQIFKCFSCGVGGNAIRFLELAEKIPYVEAMSRLADRAGIKYSSVSSESSEAVKYKNDLRSVNKIAAGFFFDALKRSEKAQNYLKMRGLTSDTVSRFGIGYSPDRPDALTAFFHGKGIDDDLLFKAGLVSKNDDRKTVVDRFRDRLMFPIFDDMGNVIAFGGRIMDKDSKLAKYINSRETPLYVKGNNLYGLNIAKKSAEKRAIVVEGYMDCIALHQKGIDFAVASLGTALTDRQARLLKRYFGEVIIAFDNDAAGKDATLRGLDILKNAGLRVKVFRLSGAKDADEYLRNHTKDDFLRQLDKCYSLFEYKCILASEEFPHGTNENTIGFVTSVKKQLRALPETDREIYTSWIIDRFGKDYGIIKENLSVSSRDDSSSQRNGAAGDKKRIFISDDQYSPGITEATLKNVDEYEKILLICLCENPGFVRSFKENGSDTVFSIDDNAKEYELILDGIENGSIKSFHDVPPGGPGFDNSIAGIYLNYNISRENALNSAVEIIRKLNAMKKDREIAEIRQQLNDETVTGARKKELLKRFMELSSSKKT